MQNSLSSYRAQPRPPKLDQNSVVSDDRGQEEIGLAYEEEG